MERLRNYLPNMKKKEREEREEKLLWRREQESKMGKKGK